MPENKPAGRPRPARFHGPGRDGRPGLDDSPPRIRQRLGRRFEDQPGNHRLRRPGELARRAFRAARGLCDHRGGRLLSGPGGRVRRQVRGSRGEAVFRALGLQAPARGRSRRRGRRIAALVPPRPGRGRGRCRGPRVPGQAGGRGRPRMPRNRRGRPGGHPEEAGFPGRLPDPRPSHLPPSPQTRSFRRAGGDRLRRGDLSCGLPVRGALRPRPERARGGRNLAPGLGARPGAVGRHHHRAGNPRPRRHELDHGRPARLGLRHRRDSRAGRSSAPAGTISSSITNIPAGSRSSSAAASSRGTGRPKASTTGCSDRRASWRRSTAGT